MNVRYRVELSQVERSDLKALLSGGKHASRKLKRAQILLAADAGAGDEEIATTRSVMHDPSDGMRGACLIVQEAVVTCLHEAFLASAIHRSSTCRSGA